jgi:hypothetical protein
MLFRSCQTHQTTVFNRGFKPAGIGTIPGAGGGYFFNVAHINAFI